MNPNQQAPNLTAYQPQPTYESEISLINIINVLLRRKILILGITAFVVCTGLFYSFTQKRVYQVETILLPPSLENIQPLNVLNSSNVNSSNVFAKFMITINSRKLKKEFFDKFKLLETLSAESTQVLTDNQKNGYFESFLNALNVTSNENSNKTITLEGMYPDRIGAWLDDLVIMANQETVNQLIRDSQTIIDSQIKSIKIEVSSKRSIYKKRREDELERLKEAYQIAKNLRIHDHLFVPNVDNESSRAISAKLNSIKNRLSNANNLSIYMKGTKMLQAEITTLKNRTSDDFNIMGLRDLQENLIRLETIKIEKNKLKTVIVDKKAVISIEPIRPKGKLIVILSLVLGGMLGIFTVFIMEFISDLKKQTD